MTGRNHIVRHWYSLGAGIVIAVMLPFPLFAQEPLCGIHALYAGAHLLDAKPNINNLLQPEFVGSEDGSSVVELERAAAKIGLHSVGVKKLTTHDLRESKWPVILHVKTDLASDSYDHFVLFGGMHEGKAKVFDGTNDVATWTLAEVASRWDGNALVLSTDPIDLKVLGAPSRRQLLYWAVALSGAVVSLLMMQKRVRTLRVGRIAAGGIEMGILCGVAGYGAWVFHATEPGGFIAGPEAVHAVRAANASTFLRTIDFDLVEQLVRSDGATVVDARSAENFRDGHIPGAVNLQAFLPPRESRRIADAVPKGRRIVVYCANAKCPFSKVTAQRLLEAGHDDVVIYPGGWNEWSDRTGARADAGQP